MDYKHIILRGINSHLHEDLDYWRGVHSRATDDVSLSEASYQIEMLETQLGVYRKL